MTDSLRDPRYLAVIQVLKQERQRLGLSQAELAARIGKVQQYVSKYESCERRLDIVELADVARALAVGLDHILEGAGVSVRT